MKIIKILAFVGYIICRLWSLYARTGTSNTQRAFSPASLVDNCLVDQQRAVKLANNVMRWAY